MIIEKIGSNQTLLKLKNGLEILYSYSTPVEGYNPYDEDYEGAYFRTTKKWSATTTRHINKYLGDHGVEILHSYSTPKNKVAKYYDQERVDTLSYRDI